MPRRIVALAAGVFLLGACGGDQPVETITSSTDIMTTTTTAAASAEDLRGSWTFTTPGLDPGLGDVELLFQRPVPGDAAGSWLAAGCIGRIEGGVSAPAVAKLSEAGPGVFDILVIATLQLDAMGDQAAVVQLSGQAMLNGPGIGDDTAGGGDSTIVMSGDRLTGWMGSHTSLEAANCRPVSVEGTALSVSFELSLHVDLVEGARKESMYLGTETNIVAAGVRVSTPSGGQTLLDPAIDIFTPWTDFVEAFRFSRLGSGGPIAGEPYHFVLLDPFGQPIAGTEGEDTWDRCELQPPVDLALEVLDAGSLRITWSQPPTAFGFDPSVGIGFYQVGIMASDGTTVAGAETDLPEHVVPWEGFGGEAPGRPSGVSYGSGLTELRDGSYLIAVAAYANDQEDPHASTACRVESYDARISFVKEGDSIRTP